MNACNQKAANIWVARIIPIVLVAIVSYSSWVIVVKVCGKALLDTSPCIAGINDCVVEYLLRSRTQARHGPRRGAAVAILTIHFILLLPMTVAYLRLVLTILTNPGFVPRGPRWYNQQTLGGKLVGNTELAIGEKSGTFQRMSDEVTGGGASTRINDETGKSQQELFSHASGLEQFYSKEVFMCQADGWPIWCSTCLNWKPDRSHHCREVGRCVEKMDHFCPWVGGIVSETSFKFFIQFVTYAALHCIFILISMAFFVSERLRERHEAAFHWILTLAFSALFGLFTIGMSSSSIDLALRNCTTVENLTRKTKVWQLAVYAPKLDDSKGPTTNIAPGMQRRAFPDVLPTAAAGASPISGGSETRCLPPTRTFVVLSSEPGENPWDLGPLENWKSVMGYHVLDWFLPLKHSPCLDHSSTQAAFATGPVVDRLRSKHGLADQPSQVAPDQRRREEEIRVESAP